MDAILATLEVVAQLEWCAVLPSVLAHKDRAGTARKPHPLVDPSISADYIVVQKTEKALSRAAALLIEHVRQEVDRVLSEWAEAPA